MSYEEARQLALELGASYVEVSSAINTNVNGLFSSIVDQLMSNLGFHEDVDEEIEEDVSEAGIIEESPSSSISEEHENVSL